MRRAGGIEREVHPLAGEPHDLASHRLAAREQCVVGAELAREFQPMRMTIDRDDAARARDPRRHHRAQADAADAEHRKRLPGANLEIVQDRAGSGLDTASQGTQKLERRVFADLHNVALGGDRVRSERRLPEEIAVNRRTAAGQMMAVVRTIAEEIQRELLMAIGRLALAATPAMTAIRKRQHHMVAGHDLGDRRPHPLDDSGPFMPEHDRPRHEGEHRSGLEIGVANAGRHHADEHFVFARPAELDVLEARIRISLPRHGRPDLHRSPSPWRRVTRWLAGPSG